MVKKPVIIYDSMNRLVWVEGQPRYGPKGSNADTRVYGKDAKRFQSNSQARAYAIKLANQQKGRVYDKYFGKYLEANTWSGEKKQQEPGFGNIFSGQLRW